MQKKSRSIRRIWFSLILVMGAALFVTGCSLTRAGYESASYQTTRNDGRYEIREYPALRLVSTPMDSGQAESDRGSFMRLFDYISGENSASKKIAMTTPVFMADDSMSFVLPEEVARTGAPTGTSPAVQLERFLPGRYAVYRVTGGRSEEKIEMAKRSLSQWLAAEGLTSVGEFIVAGYDPPFVPAILQRNEVLIRLRDDQLRDLE